MNLGSGGWMEVWEACHGICMQQVFACTGSTRVSRRSLGQCQNRFLQHPHSHTHPSPFLASHQLCFLKAAQNADSAASRRPSYRYRIEISFWYTCRYIFQCKRKFHTQFSHLYNKNFFTLRPLSSHLTRTQIKRLISSNSSKLRPHPKYK